MEKIYKLEPQSFISKLDEILNDKGINSALIRGYFQNETLGLSLSVLSDNASINKGTVVIGNTTVPREQELIEESLKTKMPKINLSDSFNIGNLVVNFKRWQRIGDFPFGFNDSFNLFHPIESVLDDKYFNKFLKIFHNSRAEKKLLITTNDYTNAPKKLYDFVDVVLILDTTNYDKNHKQQIKYLVDNLKSDGKDLPY